MGIVITCKIGIASRIFCQLCIGIFYHDAYWYLCYIILFGLLFILISKPEQMELVHFMHHTGLEFKIV